MEINQKRIDRSVVLNTWEDMYRKYPMWRDELTVEEEAEFVNDCFDIFEREGFSEVYVDQNGDGLEKYNNEPFAVIGRTSLQDADLQDLPMWDIKFEDGSKITAYPDEIILGEIKRVMDTIEKLNRRE